MATPGKQFCEIKADRQCRSQKFRGLNPAVGRELWELVFPAGSGPCTHEITDLGAHPGRGSWWALAGGISGWWNWPCVASRVSTTAGGHRRFPQRGLPIKESQSRLGKCPKSQKTSYLHSVKEGHRVERLPPYNTGSKAPRGRVCAYNQKRLLFGLRIESPVNKTIHVRSPSVNTNWQQSINQRWRKVKARKRGTHSYKPKTQPPRKECQHRRHRKRMASGQRQVLARQPGLEVNHTVAEQAFQWKDWRLTEEHNSELEDQAKGCS